MVWKDHHGKQTETGEGLTKFIIESAVYGGGKEKETDRSSKVVD